MQTHQWVGTYAGRGNGDYQGELALALGAIATYLSSFALTSEVALVRLDGQYGDAVAIAQRDTRPVCICSREQEDIEPWSILKSSRCWRVRQRHV